MLFMGVKDRDLILNLAKILITLLVMDTFRWYMDKIKTSMTNWHFDFSKFSPYLKCRAWLCLLLVTFVWLISKRLPLAYYLDYKLSCQRTIEVNEIDCQVNIHITVLCSLVLIVLIFLTNKCNYSKKGFWKRISKLIVLEMTILTPPWKQY